VAPSSKQLLAAVRQAAEGFDVFGELGRKDESDVWFLGRERAGGALAALRLKVDRVDQGAPVFALEVTRDLDSHVVMGEGKCEQCGAQLRSYARFCGGCGVDLTKGGSVPKTPADRAALLAEVRLAASDAYEVLGEMPWGGGAGLLYFALEKATHRLVRLRLKIEGEEVSLGETVALMTLDHRIQGGYVTTAAPRPSGDIVIRVSGQRPAAPQPEAGPPAAPASTPSTAAPLPGGDSESRPGPPGLLGRIRSLFTK